MLEHSKLHTVTPTSLVSSDYHPPRAVVPGTVRPSPSLNNRMSPPIVSDGECSSDGSEEEIPKEAFKVFNLTPKFNNMPPLAPKPSLMSNSLPSISSAPFQHHVVPLIGQNLLGRGRVENLPNSSPPSQDPIWRQFSALKSDLCRSTPYNKHNPHQLSQQQIVNNILSAQQRHPPTHPAFYPHLPHQRGPVPPQHSNTLLRGHMFPPPRAHHTSGIHSCPYCPFQVADVDTLHDHILSHGIESINWSCPYCPQPNQMSRNFVAKHIKNAHPGFHVVYIPFGVTLR